MGTRQYICLDCVKNHEHIAHCFSLLPKNFDEDITECHYCHSNNIKLMNITKEELLKILDISKDINFILAMDQLKADNIIDFNIKLSQANTSSKPSISTSIPKCPTCSSTDIKKISGTKRWLGVGLFGLASSTALKSYECLNCQYKW